MATGRIFGGLIGRDGAALREAFAALPEAVMLLDANGRLLAASDAAAAALAPLAPPPEGEDVLALLAPADRAALAAAFAEPEPPPLRLPLPAEPPRSVGVRATRLASGRLLLRLSAGDAEAG